MSFTLIILFTVIGLLFLTVSIVVDGLKDRNMKKIIIPIIIFVAAIMIGYYGLIGFITSM